MNPKEKTEGISDATHKVHVHGRKFPKTGSSLLIQERLLPSVATDEAGGEPIATFSVKSPLKIMNDIKASRDNQDEQGKEMSPFTRKFFEELFGYYKMVCDSNMPFPGFRCGPGGSVSHRRPFMSGRLGAYLKACAKEEENQSGSVDSNSFTRRCSSMTKISPLGYEPKVDALALNEQPRTDLSSSRQTDPVSSEHSIRVEINVPSLDEDEDYTNSLLGLSDAKAVVLPMHPFRKNNPILFPRLFTAKMLVFVSSLVVLVVQAHSQRIMGITERGVRRAGGQRGESFDFDNIDINKIGKVGPEPMQSPLHDRAQLQSKSLHQNQNNRPLWDDTDSKKGIHARNRHREQVKPSNDIQLDDILVVNNRFSIRQQEVNSPRNVTYEFEKDDRDDKRAMNRLRRENINPMSARNAFNNIEEPVLNNTMTDENIHYAAYLWVTNNTVAHAAYGGISTWNTSAVT